MSTIVSTQWLADNFRSPDLRVIDASWYLPASGRNAWDEYVAGHIPGAVYFDLEALSRPESPLPHTLPLPEQFARTVGALGIGDRHQVIVYDSSGTNMSAARAWWMFRVYGHAEAAVLDGGSRKWRAEGRGVEPDAITPLPVSFTPRFDAALVRSLADMRHNLTDHGAQVVDARSSGRFQGEEPEPRPGLRPGHIPRSLNVPYTSLVRQDGTLLPPEELRRRFADAGVDLDRPVVTTCGSGVTACDLLLALDVLGHRDNALYDGSWSEWGALPDTPVVRGPA